MRAPCSPHTRQTFFVSVGCYPPPCGPLPLSNSFCTGSSRPPHVYCYTHGKELSRPAPRRRLLPARRRAVRLGLSQGVAAPRIRGTNRHGVAATQQRQRHGGGVCGAHPSLSAPAHVAAQPRLHVHGTGHDTRRCWDNHLQSKGVVRVALWPPLVFPQKLDARTRYDCGLLVMGCGRFKPPFGANTGLELRAPTGGV